MPAGLADSQALVLNATPDIIDYTSLLPSGAPPAPEPRIPVVLGILPLMDVVEVELLGQEQLLALYSGRSNDSEPNIGKVETAKKYLHEFW